MAVRMSTLPTQSRFGVTVQHAFMSHEEGSDRLLVMLPGRGYTCEHPVMYYLRQAALEGGFDVLSVQYGFQAAGVELDVESTVYLQEDVEQAAAQALSRGYRHVSAAGKSLGTPLAAELVRSLTVEQTSLILLTPIGGAVQGLGSIPTLVVIGTGDALYSEDEVAGFDRHPSVQWCVFDGLNHALEQRDDWQGSLRVLPEIIAVCADFLAQQSART